MTDTLWQRVAWFAGEVARPYCLIAVGTSTAWTIFDGKDAAVIGAAGLILAGLYGARAIESGFQSKKAADVETARIQSSPSQKETDMADDTQIPQPPTPPPPPPPPPPFDPDLPGPPPPDDGGTPDQPNP